MSSSSSRVLLLATLLALLLAASVEAKKKNRSDDELFNLFLGPAYAQWLVGPIAEVATDEEINAFLALMSDDEAKAFIEDFWAQRNATAPVFGKTPEQVFEARAVEADKRFTEGAYPGRRSARGAKLIVFGEPESIEFESPERVGDPPLELWTYAKDAEVGLGGDKPKRRYRFVKIENSTVLYTGQKLRQDPRERLRRRRN